MPAKKRTNARIFPTVVLAAVYAAGVLPAHAQESDQPNLQVGVPTVSDASTVPSGSFTLSATVSNTGAGKSAATTLRYFRSTDATITTSDTSMGTDEVGALAASGTSAESIKLTAPSTAGTYYFGACVDTVTNESDTTDNCSSSVSVEVLAPDLEVVFPGVAPRSVSPFDTFILGATVRNRGNGDARVATTLRYYYSVDATISTADTEIGTDTISSLAASASSDEAIVLRARSAKGTYYYGACIDVTVQESNSSNNCSTAVTLVVGAPPDLEVGTPTVSDASPATDGTFTLSATVRNTGAGRSAATTLRWYRSTDATITTSDTSVGTDEVGRLHPSRTSSESISLTAPSTAGTYYYGACVDTVTDESDTTDNCSSSVRVDVSEPAPDLEVGPPSVSDSGPATGGSFTLSATVRNTGAGRSAATTLRWYRSTDATITTSDTATGTDEVGGLAASGTSSESISLTAPATAGTYYYGACVDTVTDESDTTDNCSSSVRVDVSEPAPDLEVGPPSVSDAGPATGGSFTLSATVRNTGTGGSAATTLRWYRSADATITTSDTSVGTDEVGGLAASGTSSESISLTAPSTAGTYYYGACVDAVTDESDITDNCSSSVGVDVSELAPDLEVGTPTVSTARPVAGASFSLSATVRNTGTGGSAATTLRYYRSTDATITTSDTSVGTDAVGALSASGTSAQSIVLTAPSTSGTYYYGACVDTVTDESDTTDNCSAAVPVHVVSSLGSSQPDLEVVFPGVAPRSVSPFDTFILLATVRNRGNGDARVATTLRYYYSVDATISTADTEIGTDTISSLAASASSEEAIVLRARSAGTYYYGACIDVTIRESDTSNNCSTAVTLVVGAPPDLEVGTPTVSASSPTTGGAFTLSATVRNTGAGRSAATTLRWYRSTDATITTSDTSVGTDEVGRLHPSRTSSESITLTAPSASGTYYYGACVDAVTDEPDTTDNCSSSVRVDVSEPAPDLEVGTPSASDSGPAPGGSFTLSATVRNSGTGGAAATTLRWYRSTDATITTSDTSVGTDAVGGLATSRASSESISLTAPSTAGTYYYGACVDAVTDETDTADNCSSSVRVDVSEPAPDLEVGTPSVSDAGPATGGSFTLSATVRNAGTGGSAATTLRWYRSTDATITTSDTSVGTDAVGGIAASGTSSKSVSLTAPSASTSGTYYYGACVDAVTDESDTTDNCSPSVKVQVGAAPPDLEVGTPTVSAARPVAGASFTLSATVRNTGAGGAAATTLRWYRSTDATITTSDTSVGTDAVGGLAASGTSSESITLTAPSMSGTYYYGACVDAVSDESDTTDNCSSSVRVDVSEPAPDLEVGTPSVSDAGPVPGGSFTLRATVWNTGTEGSAATTLRWYRSTDATITTSDTSVGTDAVGGLVASGTSSESITLTAPSASGTYYYGACVDAVTDETDTADNCSSSVRVGVGAPPPDLEVGTPTASDAGLAKGGAFTLSATVRNAGTGGSAATTLRWYRSTDAAITTSDTAVGTDAVQALSASGTSEESISLTAPSTAGRYYYGACVDAVTDESDTTDNCSASVKVDVEVPIHFNLVIETPSVSDDRPTAGSRFSLSATVGNSGNSLSKATTLRFYHSTDATITTSDTSVGMEAVSRVAVSGSSTKSMTLTAPSTVGKHYYGACVDAPAGESDSSDNCSAAVPVHVVSSSGSSQPDLEVLFPGVAPRSVSPFDTFILGATVRNRGNGDARVAATLRYYYSADATITTADTEVGTDTISSLAASASSDEAIVLRASAAGTFYYGACIDVTNQESDSSNNCSAAVALTVEGETPADQPDLTVQSASASPHRPSAGGIFTVSATVSNVGGEDAVATSLRILRSEDQVISGSDTEVGATTVVSLTAYAGSARHSVGVTAPTDTGTYYYGACVDAVTDEADTTNNCSSSVRVDVSEPAPDLVGAPSPDLEVGTPTVSDAAPFRGGSFTLSATVRNTGTGGSAATTLRWFRSTDATITISDTSVGTDGVVVLAASGTSDESISIQLGSPDTPPGTYYYGACVDAVTDEADTTDNCSTGTRVDVRSPNPVFGIPTVSDATPLPGGSFTMSVTVSNTGTATYAVLGYVVSPDPSIQPWEEPEDEFVGEGLVAELAASETGTASIVLTAPSTPGTHYYGVCLNSPNDLRSRNIFLGSDICSPSVKIVVGEQPPDLGVGTPTVSDAGPAPGGSFTLSATVSNRGTERSAATTLRWYRSTDATITTSDTSVGTDTVGALSASGTSSESISVTAPSTAGTYFYGACVDAVTDESDTTDNCSPSVKVVVGAPPPDLEVGTPTVSNARPQTGGSFTLSATVDNTGSGGAAATTLRWYRSTDATITTSDSSVGTDAVAALAAAGMSAESIPLIAPSTTGTYYYGACVDAVTDESDTTDNCSASVEVTVVTARPNLRVGTPSVTDAGPDTGGEFELSVLVRNWAAVGSAATTLRWYRSADATITSSDSSVGTDAVEALVALGTGSESISLTAPERAGAYYYGACVDAVADESDTTDNCSPSVKVEVGAEPPDLIVSTSIAYGSAGTFRILARVYNQGSGGSAATTLRYYRSTDATITTSDTSVGTDALAGLAASGTSVAGRGMSVPSTADSYYYMACVDPVAGESDTTNNCSNAVRVDGEDENATPRLLRASVDDDALTLTFSETLDGNSVPPVSSFAVTVAGSVRTVDAVAVSGSSVTLTLSSSVSAGEAVTVGYTVPTGEDAKQVQDADGGPATAFADIRVTNETGPLPVVSIAASTSPVTEGTAASFILYRTGPAGAALTVAVSVAQSGSVLGGNLPSSATFQAGSAEARLAVPTVNDETEEADSRVTASIAAGEGYAVDGGSAGVDVLDDDATPAPGAPAAALWSTTMIWTDLGAGRYGGYTADFRNPEWAEGGQRFRIWWIAYDSGTRALEVVHDGSGGTIAEADGLALHVGGFKIESGEALSAFARGSLGRVREVASQWEVGDWVTVRLVRSTVATAPAPTDSEISVADAQVNESSGAPLRFVVTLDAAAAVAVSVRYRTSDGTARAGADYVAAHGALRFAPGETEKTVAVRVLPDNHDEGSETMTLSLSQASGARLAAANATGTIVNTGPSPRAWIARFGRTVADQVLDAVQGRMRAARVPGSEVNLGGQRIGLGRPFGNGVEEAGAGTSGARTAEDPGAQRATGDMAAWLKGATDPETGLPSAGRTGVLRTMSDRELLGSSFSMTAQTAGKGLVSIWGRGTVTRFDGREDTLSLDGDVASAMLGTDFSQGRWTTGIVVAHSLGEGGYRDGGESTESGTISATLTGLHPWLRHVLSDRVEAWGVAGYGEGSLTLEPGEGPAIRTDLDFWMAAAGLRGTFVDGGDEGLTLTGKTDAMIVQTSTDAVSGSETGNLAGAEAEVTRLRLALEGTRPLRLSDGSVLTPGFEIGLRHDDGDAETGFGAEVGARLVYADPSRGLAAELHGRGLLTHEAEGFRELGLSGSFSWEPVAGGRGPQLSLTQTLGSASPGSAEALFRRGTLDGLAANDNGDDRRSRRLEARLGYGFAAVGDRFTWTPEVGIGLSDTGREMSFGWRLEQQAGPGGDTGSLELSFEARQQESVKDDMPPEYEVGLRLQARF